MVLWKALRCSSAAPTYFPSVDNKYVDGGLMANNPTMVLMHQVDDYRRAIEWATQQTTKRNEKAPKPKIGCVISIGCGRIPNVPVDALDMSVSQNRDC